MAPMISGIGMQIAAAQGQDGGRMSEREGHARLSLRAAGGRSRGCESRARPSCAPLRKVKSKLRPARSNGVSTCSSAARGSSDAYPDRAPPASRPVPSAPCPARAAPASARTLRAAASRAPARSTAPASAAAARRGSAPIPTRDDQRAASGRATPPASGTPRAPTPAASPPPSAGPGSSPRAASGAASQICSGSMPPEEAMRAIASR